MQWQAKMHKIVQWIAL